MFTYFEQRHRYQKFGELYKVRSWYLFGFILVYRRWEQLTSRQPLPDERQV